MIRRSVLSDEYVTARVRGLDAGAVIDVSSDAVDLAIKLDGVDPVELDWTEGEWEVDDTNPAAVRYIARALPSAIFSQAAPFTAGRYKVWVRVHDSPEVVAEPVYTLILY